MIGGSGMKVGDLLDAIEHYKKDHSDIMDWDVYVEQLPESQRSRYITCFLRDSEGCDYCKCFGNSTLWPRQKIITIKINY